MFEQVNKAYEFLCSKSKVKDGPDPQNIVLILRAQSILFSRYKEGQHRRSLSTHFVAAVVVVFIAFIQHCSPLLSRLIVLMSMND